MNNNLGIPTLTNMVLILAYIRTNIHKYGHVYAFRPTYKL